MERNDIVETLTKLFREIFCNHTLEIRDDLTANDVDQWDSLSHMLLISEIEKAFSIKFKLKELNKMRNVGDMINIIKEKV